MAMGIGWKGAPCMLVALGLDSSFLGKAALVEGSLPKDSGQFSCSSMTPDDSC